MGMFDPSARTCVPLDVMTMAFPMKRFVKVIGFMEESFLITKTWETVKKKIERSGAMYKKDVMLILPHFLAIVTYPE